MPVTADRDDGAVGGQGQPGHAGLAAGQPPVRGARALGVDAEAAAGAAAPTSPCRAPPARPGASAAWTGSAPSAVKRMRVSQPADPGAGEVLGLREVADAARRHERDDHAVDERQVVARDDERAVDRHVLAAGRRSAGTGGGTSAAARSGRSGRPRQVASSLIRAGRHGPPRWRHVHHPEPSVRGARRPTGAAAWAGRRRG